MEGIRAGEVREWRKLQAIVRMSALTPSQMQTTAQLCAKLTWSDLSYLHKRIALAAVLQTDSKETALRSSCWMDPGFRREGENGGINRRVISICMKLDEIRKGVFYAERRKRPSLSPQHEEQEKRRK